MGWNWNWNSSPMEVKQLVLSALSVGVGVGVGLGLVSGQGMRKWGALPTLGGMTVERIEEELMRQVMEGKDINVSFDDFPYYLCPQTRALLESVAYFHLKGGEFSKHTRNLSPASQAILLSGPAELYQQMLAKALANCFNAKLLLLDVTEFSLKIQSKYGSVDKKLSFKRSASEVAFEKVSNIFGSFTILRREEAKGSLAGLIQRQSYSLDIRSRISDENNLPKLHRNDLDSSDFSDLATRPNASAASLKRTCSWGFDEKVLLQSLYKVLTSVSKGDPIVLYVRDIENLLCRSERVYLLFQKMLKKITGPVLILGSTILEYRTLSDIDNKITTLFPYNIKIKDPENEKHLVRWKNQLEEDMKMLRFQDNRNHISEVLAANDLECDDLGSICVADKVVLGKYIQEVVVTAVSHHLINNKNLEYRNGKLLISSKSLSHGLSIFQEGKDTLKLEVNGDEAKEVIPENEFEKRIKSEVIPANEIGVTFDDIGALGDVKESLQELVMLPLRRPDLFNGGLLKPCKGILLFGPPGTGKTMLAKAIAHEAGASFINVSMSTITSKWFGEDEKNVRALFTLAAKVSPTIIFVDEVDSMLGHRTRVGEHEAMRKIKNEFMTHWDGLLTKLGERILVLAATNRPFDLDEAIIRRFERRIMVGLPSVENREQILRTLLSKEKIDGLDLKELAMMTEGYSGSDLKNLCTTAAYRPVRELMQKENEKELARKQKGQQGEKPETNDTTKESDDVKITLRMLNIEDMRQAKNQVSASFSGEGSGMSELKEWNELYGEGGSRKKQQLSYFL